MPELLKGIKSEQITEVTEMPASTNIEVSRIPTLLPIQKKSTKTNINLNYVSFFFILHFH